MLRELLFSNWSIVRIIRTVFGLFLTINGFVESDYLIIGLGAVLLLQGVFQIGCASGTCTNNSSEIKKDE